MALRNGVQLICYPDRIGDNIQDLHSVLNKYCRDAVCGVHLLPFYPSNADAGFSPLTHMEVDPRVGDWQQVRALAADYDLCADLIINHIADESVEFLDLLAKGKESEYYDLFVHVDELEPITHDDLSKIHIRKEKEPFREITYADGSKGRVWCTFTEHQVDLNYISSDKARQLMAQYMTFLADVGVRLFRLDAFGYLTKEIGTSCFLVEPDVYRQLDWFNDLAHSLGTEVLPEVHDHTSFQYAISRRQMHCYGFALPPLMLHAMFSANSRYLKNWLRMCPRNMVTVLDTHDGICIPDVEGVIPDDEISQLIDNLNERSADPILRRSALNPHSVGAIYQLTCTFYEAMMKQDDGYICARAIQFFTPGIPQVYYVGLLAGLNDYELCDSSGEAREINRHYYSLNEVDDAMQQDVVKRQLALMAFRNNSPAFDGHFELNSSSDDSVSMGWRHGEHYAHLFVDLNFKTATITEENTATGMRKVWKC